jgi:hypothetical protein
MCQAQAHRRARPQATLECCKGGSGGAVCAWWPTLLIRKSAFAASLIVLLMLLEQQEVPPLEQQEEGGAPPLVRVAAGRNLSLPGWQGSWGAWQVRQREGRGVGGSSFRWS